MQQQPIASTHTHTQFTVPPNFGGSEDRAFCIPERHGTPADNKVDAMVPCTVYSKQRSFLKAGTEFNAATYMSKGNISQACAIPGAEGVHKGYAKIMRKSKLEEACPN
eukprot:3882728-Amphidinium_carterae.1